MGILNLFPFLRKKYPNIIKEVPVSEFRGRRFVVDADNWMRVNMSFANSNAAKHLNIEDGETLNRSTVLKNWLDLCLTFAHTLLSRRITPIFVFDGEYPVEKMNTQGDRRSVREKLKSEIVDLREKMTTDPDKTTSDRLRGLLARDTSIARDDKATLINVLKALGIPVITAPGESEKHCAYLVQHGYADVVFSGDSDTLCFGAGCVVNKIIQGGSAFQVIELKDVLKSLGESFDTFIDLCIMAGCDYNQNIPGIGIGKSYVMLKECKRIENLPKNLDISILNHEVCRRLFKHTSTKVIVDDIMINPGSFIKNGKNTLKMFGLDRHFYRFAPIIAPDMELEDGDIIDSLR
jgi:flap endonuclease-1